MRLFSGDKFPPWPCWCQGFKLCEVNYPSPCQGPVQASSSPTGTTTLDSSLSFLLPLTQPSPLSQHPEPHHKTVAAGAITPLKPRQGSPCTLQTSLPELYFPPCSLHPLCPLCFLVRSSKISPTTGPLLVLFLFLWFTPSYEP